jgi:UDP-galactose transporter B1
MGRQKQTAPLQRNPSSELMHTLPDEPEVAQQNHANGDAINHSGANGKATTTVAAVSEPVADSPGLMQLLICVLGIYAAL